nr:hypothetical protein [Tanacetum cinerariifolium]
PKEDEFEEEENPQEEEDDIEVDIEKDKNEPELTYPYEEMDPPNPPPPTFESEPGDAIEVKNLIEHDNKTVLARVHEPPTSKSEPEDAIKVENPIKHEDETVLASVHEEKAKDEYYGKLILDLGNEVCSSVEQGTAAMDKLVESVVTLKDNVDAAIAAERARQANVRNEASRSGPVRGAVKLLRWFEKTESVFGISECAEGKKVKFVAVTFQGPALTWWNDKIAIRGLETNLKVKEYNIVAYISRFNELAWMCPRMVKTERVKVDAYIQGLTDNIKGEVTFSRPANLNEVVRMAHKLMDQKAQARDERILEGKKRK